MFSGLGGLGREGLTEVGHDMAKLCSADGAVAVLVKHLECLLDLLLAVSVLHFPCHHCQEFGCGCPLNARRVE